MEFTRLTGHIGADVHGIDLTRPLSPDQVTTIRQGLVEHLVLFFREQRMMTVDEHKRLGGYFGELEPSAYLTPGIDSRLLVLDAPGARVSDESKFHADSSWRADPPMGAILQAQIMPKVGGDTCFASMYAAYETLSPKMQGFLEGLDAFHSVTRLANKIRSEFTLAPGVRDLEPQKHPVIRIHPESGRKLLNVNCNYTTHIDGMREDESAALLAFLYEHIKSPHFQVRMRWNLGDVTFWDNRAVQHCAIPDYTERRRVQRVSILPFGSAPTAAEQKIEMATAGA